MSITFKVTRKNEVEFSCDELEMLIDMTECDSLYACTQYDDWEDKMKMCFNVCKKLKELYERFCEKSEEGETGEDVKGDEENEYDE